MNKPTPEARRPEPATLPWIELERNGPVPLQAQIVRWVESLIVSGQLAPSDRLPSEAVIVMQLGVSRVTVRLAFDELVARGLIARSHGRGSFVAASVVRHDLLSEQGFFDIVLAQAAKPKARLLTFEPEVPPASVARLFGLGGGQKAMRFERIYTSAGKPVVFATGWLTPDASGLTHKDIESRSTAALHVDVLGKPVVSSTTSISARLVTAAVARRLAIRARGAVLVLVRSRFDANGGLREYLRFLVDPSAYEFTLSDEVRAQSVTVTRAVTGREMG
jgi:GntR family transcriptional regulator